MELIDIIAGRKSIRRFTDEPVPQEDIVKIIRAAGLAPSASNRQMWHFLIVKNRDKIEQMKQAVLAAIDEATQWPESEPYTAILNGSRANTFFTNAPVVIAVLAQPYRTPLDTDILPKHGLSFEEIYKLRGDPGRQSIGAAIQNLLLMAHDMGYGTCWMTGPLIANPAFRGILNVQPEWDLVAIIPLGRPANHPEPRPRRSVEENFTVIE